MKRVLLDTNIYGELIFDEQFVLLKEKIPSLFVVHGFQIVRQELRAVPSRIKTNGVNVRLGVLHIYDELTKKSYAITSDVKRLSELYHQSYRLFGGSLSYDAVKNDFMIVACASIHGIDIVVSEDAKTMLVESAKKAYSATNNIEKLRIPTFIGYLEFKKWLAL